jgi:hypothetical protein
MASLRLNPVMNIIALPFALVVSVIAATTVFRNVFIAHDGFASGSSSGQHGANSSSVGYSLPRFFTGGTRSLTSWSRGPTKDRIPLDEYKSQDVGAISIHRVVDIDVDTAHGSATVS